LSAAIDTVIDLYGCYWLLTFDRDPLTREPTVEVAHEVLIRAWSRLRAWPDECREDLRIQRRLAAAAHDSTQSGRDPSHLSSDARLAQFEALVVAPDPVTHSVASGRANSRRSGPEAETAYLQASPHERD
jgi:hypothetical protein